MAKKPSCIFEHLLISPFRYSKLISPLKSKQYCPTHEFVKCVHAFGWTKGRVNRVHYRWADHTGSGFPRAAQVTLETSAASHLFITSFLISHFCLALAGALEFYQSWTTLRNRDIILAQSTIKVCNLCPRLQIHRDSQRFFEIICNSARRVSKKIVKVISWEDSEMQLQSPFYLLSKLFQST